MSILSIRGHHIDASLLHDQAKIIDLGGHKGEFSQDLTTRFGCTSHVVEAMPELFEKIIPNEHIHTYHYAIGKSNGFIEFHLSSNPESNSIFSQSTTDGDTIKVPAITLKSFMELVNVRYVDLLKMDIEGAEIAVFDSLDDEHLQSIKQITVEFHDFIPELHLEKDVERIMKRMKDLHFHCIVFSRKTHFDVLFLHPDYTSSTRALYIRFIKYVHGVKRIIDRTLGKNNQ